jgi:hypothetical protein
MTSGRNRSSGGSHGGGHYVYYPEVTYEYQVDGTTYTSSKINVIMFGSDISYAQGVLNRYPIGSTVDVHYNPDNPSDAVLETQVDIITYGPLIIGIVFISIVVLGSVYAFRTKGRERSKQLLNDGHLRIERSPTRLFIDFRWEGRQTLVSNVGNSQMNPRLLSTLWIVFGIALILLFGAALFLIPQDEPNNPAFILIIFIGIMVLLIYDSVAYLLNHTTILVTKDILEVRAHPIPYRRLKRIECSKFNQVYAENAIVKGMRGTRMPYTKLIAETTDSRTIT